MRDAQPSRPGRPTHVKCRGDDAIAPSAARRVQRHDVDGSCLLHRGCVSTSARTRPGGQRFVGKEEVRKRTSRFDGIRTSTTATAVTGRAVIAGYPSGRSAGPRRRDSPSKCAGATLGVHRREDQPQGLLWRSSTEQSPGGDDRDEHRQQDRSRMQGGRVIARRRSAPPEAGPRRRSAVWPGRRADPAGQAWSRRRPRLGRAQRGLHAEAHSRTGRRLLLRLPDGSDSVPAGDQTGGPGDPMERAVLGCTLSERAALRARVPAGDGPGAPVRDNDSPGLPGPTVMSGRPSCFPPPDREVSRVRLPRPLAGELPPATAGPRRIDNHRAVRRRLVSAVLLGGNVGVARGRDAGACPPGGPPADGLRSSPACSRSAR